MAATWLLIAGCEVLQPPPTVEHELAVTVTGTGTGTVVSTPDGIDTAAGAMAAAYPRGTTIWLRATPSEGSVFGGFSVASEAGVGCRSGRVATLCILTLEEAVDVTATFSTAPVVTDPESLTVVVEGGGGGRVWTAPIGIDTTASGTFEADFERGATVSVNATPNGDSLLDGFIIDGGVSECGSGSGPTSCVLTLDAATEVTVSFSLDEVAVVAADRFDLVATLPVAGAQIEFLLPWGASVSSVAALNESVALRTATTGDHVRVAWISDAPREGSVIRLILDRVTDPDAISLTEAAAFASASGGDVGATTLRWRNIGDEVPPSATLLDDLPVASASTTLSASFADHRLGDLDANGVLDARDALRWLEVVQGDAFSPFERYHADLDGDDLIDADDLALLLEKLVDPTLPARLNVKPATLSFAQLDPGSGGPGVVLAANLGNQPFSVLSLEQVPSGTAAVVGGEVEGHALGLEVTIPPAHRLGWLPGFATIGADAGQTFDVRLGHLVVLIAGQSNAVGFGLPLHGWPEAPTDRVRMLGNDYVWKDAREPLDDWTGQLDTVSFEEYEPQYSFGTRLGNLLHEATGFVTYLVPAARGGSTALQWQPPSNPLDRSTLFGSAAFRGRVSGALSANPVQAQELPSEGGPVSVLVWFQGESDSSLADRRDRFVERTNRVMNGFRDVLGIPVIYVQLAAHERALRNRQQHAIGELQRNMETGFGGFPRQRFHMVASYDLPLYDEARDVIHLSAYAQRVLAERIDLAVREHVLGEAVDGTGPRLESITRSGSSIRLKTTHVLAAGAYDPAFFAVFDGAPVGNLRDDDYGVNTIPIDGVGRDPSDARSVLIQLARPPDADLVPHVRYMSPAAPPSSTATWDVIAAGVVRAEGDGPGGVGLPLPTFGPAPVAP